MHVSVQRKGNISPKNNEEKIWKKLKKLYAQGLFWKPNSKNVLCWAFYCVNDNKEVDLIVLQVMHCIICYNSPILNLNSKTQVRRELIVYNTTNGITTLRKHVNVNHLIILEFWKSEQSFEIKGKTTCKEETKYV